MAILINGIPTTRIRKVWYYESKGPGNKTYQGKIDADSDYLLDLMDLGSFTMEVDEKEFRSVSVTHSREGTFLYLPPKKTN